MTTESHFYQACQSFLDEIFQEFPVVATIVGDHRFDDQLVDYSLEGHRRQRAMLDKWQKQFDSYQTTSWPPDAQIDLTLMIQLVKNFIRGFDVLRGDERDPSAAAGEGVQGVYLLILRNFAPLPERLKSILGRLRQIPRVLEEGRAYLKPVEVPPIWAEIALEMTQQSVGLFAGFLPSLAAAAPEIQDELIQASQAAAAALQAHAQWIEETVLPQAAGDYAVGKPLFDELLREDHMVDYDADELLATGWKLYEETHQQMVALATQMDPEKTVDQLLEEAKTDHPTGEGLLDAYRHAMAQARQVVIDQEIVTIPEGESIRIEPTPPFLRPIIPFAAYMMPGFLEELQEGVFIVTPVDENADPETAEAKLRGHPLSKIPVTALHEAYPGHHLQLVFANQVGSMPRKVGAFLSTLFIEGWAFYCEELMEQLGYIDQPIQRLGRLQAQRWRACRIIIDSSLHTGKMTVEEAISFLVEKGGLEPDDAKAEVRRYTQTPTQPQSYLMGKLEILQIVDEYKKRYPNASMREMHDAILSCGSLPPKLMRQRLFGAA